MVTYTEYINYVRCVFKHNKDTIFYSLAMNAIMAFVFFFLLSTQFGSYSSVIDRIMTMGVTLLILGLWVMINIGYAYEITLIYYNGVEPNSVSSNNIDRQEQESISEKQVTDSAVEKVQKESSNTSILFYLNTVSAVITVITGVIAIFNYMDFP